MIRKNHFFRHCVDATLRRCYGDAVLQTSLRRHKSNVFKTLLIGRLQDVVN